ncbi:MAG: hypothetical protein AABZ53_11560 [Planctomycetota bacterium]
MGILIAGIDEAGYGPLLGPLAVGTALLRVEGWSPGERAPNLWSLLSKAVSPTLKGASGRIVIADSKTLKLSNSGTRNPLTHLERGVLAVLASAGDVPATDMALLERLATRFPPHACYAGEALAVPMSCGGAEIAIAANVLRGAMEAGGVRLLGLGCRLIGEEEFNALVRDGHGKGATTIAAIRTHVRRLVATLPKYPDDAVRVVCDRLGGRAAYSDVIESCMGESELESLEILEESEARSRYRTVVGGREIGFVFQTESESAYMPVALASMVAKLCRELAMNRFNRHWCASLPELTPTAGYWQDARRWLKDVGKGLSADDRRRLVRIA